MKIRPRLKYILLTLTIILTPVAFILYQDPLSLFFLETPSPVASYFCKDEAIKYLESSDSSLPFQRCEEKIFPTSNTDRYLKRIYIVAGKVSRGWEFECGHFINCTRQVIWLDNNNNLISFVEPPVTPLNDYAVKSTGCAYHGTRVGGIATEKPELIFQDGQYWWKQNYDRTPTSGSHPSCIISGWSLTSTNKVKSAIKVDKVLNEDVAHTIRLQRAAISNRDKSKCSWLITKRKRKKKKSITQRNWDEECLWNYILATGDRSICKEEFNLIGMDGLYCDNILKQELEIINPS